MKIAIIGAGAMGCLYGGYLSLDGHEVILLDVRAEHIQQINQSGLRIDEPDGSVIAHPRASVSASAEMPADLAIVMVKSTDTAAALAANQAVLGPGTLVLTLQNGYGNADDLARCIDPDRILIGTTAHGCQLLGPGHIRHAGSGQTVLGAFRNLPASSLNVIVVALNAAGFDTCQSTDIQRLVWHKLLINVGINPLTALLKIQNGELNTHEETRCLMRTLIQEAVVVARAAGQDFDPEEVYQNCLSVAERTAANRSSMLQDIEHKRPSEIRRINGAIVDLGHRYNRPVPCNEAITNLILALEKVNQ